MQKKIWSGKEQKVLYKKVDKLLWNEWDPIGVNDIPDARDEYIDYIPHILNFIRDEANRETIAQWLFSIEVAKMGLAGDLEGCRKIAGKISQVEITNVE